MIRPSELQSGIGRSLELLVTPAVARDLTEPSVWAWWLYDGFDVDGILYLSRLTGAECVAVYDWTLASKLRSTRVADLTALADLPPALQSLNVRLV